MSGKPPSHRLVIVGGGVAGLEIASTLARQRRLRGALDVILVDSDSAHVWKPMLHTIAAGTSDISQQQTAFLAQARQAGFTFQPGALEGLNRTTREIRLAPLYAPDGRLLIPARELSYDTLVIAIGSEANDFGTPGAAEHCYRIDSRQQADAFHDEVRLRLLQCLSQQSKLRIGIVGGGATGVELAAELVQLVESSVGYGAHGLREHVTVTLVESGPRLLAAFPEDISAATRTRLEALGIRVLTEAFVGAVDAEGFVLKSGERIPVSLPVWAAGVKAPDFLTRLDGLATSPNNQLVVRPSLQTTHDARIYAVGDCASLTLPGMQRPLGPTAQVAHQQAQHLIRYLPGAMLQGKPIPDFKNRNFGAVVSLGEYDAFASLGQFGFLEGTTIQGRLAQLSHVMLYRSHQARLHGFWRGSLLWLVDYINQRLRGSIRLD
ncbi:MAG: NAD(P)/FAD-dependent oxidoreductase [Comamonas sp.]